MKESVLKVYSTARDNPRAFSSLETETLESGEIDDARLPVVTLLPRERYQRFLGFGGALTESSAQMISLMGREEGDGILEAYFHPGKGNRYRFCRSHIGSCDFSRGNYSSMEEHERFLIPALQRLMDIVRTHGSEVSLLLSPWSPPAWMKDNGSMTGGGSLKRNYYRQWAAAMLRFVKYYENRGIPVWGITAQNEPDAVQIWESCTYSPEQEADFIGNHLGPLREHYGLEKLHILGWDHNRDGIAERIDILRNNKEAAAHLWGAGFHWYSGEDWNLLSPVYERFPDLPLIMTEACLEGGAKPGRWDRGEIYARHIIGDLNHGASGWIDWNILLDTQGGPNHAGNHCDAPILLNRSTGEVVYQSSYYYIGHFSRFIEPGAVRIGYTASLNTPLGKTAFLNPDGTRVLVLLNETDKVQQIGVAAGSTGESEKDEAKKTDLPPRSIATILFG